MDDAVLRKKEQKDVELDKKILALRKKNEALIRRYQVSLQVFTFPSSVLESSTHLVRKMVSSVRVTLLYRYHFYIRKNLEHVGRALPLAMAPELHWKAGSPMLVLLLQHLLLPYHLPLSASHLSHPFTSYSPDFSPICPSQCLLFIFLDA